MAAMEGFEPSRTESESGVLPLHYIAINYCTGNYNTLSLDMQVFIQYKIKSRQLTCLLFYCFY